MERWARTWERIAGGLSGKGGISWRARRGEIGLGGRGSSICRYHGTSAVVSSEFGVAEGGSNSDDGSKFCRDCRREEKLLKARGGCNCGLKSRGLEACAGIEIPAIEVNASSTEKRHEVHRVMDRCMLLQNLYASRTEIQHVERESPPCRV